MYNTPETRITKIQTPNGTNHVYKSVEHRYRKGTIQTCRLYHVFIGCHLDAGTETEAMINYGHLTRFNFTNKTEAIKYARTTIAPKLELVQS